MAVGAVVPPLAVLASPNDRLARVLDYRTYRLRDRRATSGAQQAKRMGRIAKNMNLSLGSTPSFTGAEALKIFAGLRKFVKACNYNAVT